jgi:hypothetical protein
MRRLTIFLVTMLLPVACGGGIDSGDPSTTSTSTSSGTSTTVALAPIETTTTTTADPTSPSSTTTITVQDELTTPELSLDAVVAAAVTDLSARLGVPSREIEIQSRETGVWRDGSIGCPDPDTVYTQALVPGTRVALSYAKVTYWYHQGGNISVFLCEQPQPRAFVGSPNDEFLPPPGFND